MLILGIDTAAAPCCAAEKGQILGSTVINNKLTHSVTLMPVVRDLVRNAELSMEDIGLFAVANGPGSFTGLRIGISAVKGLAFALSKPCAAVSTLEAMAYNVTAYDCCLCRNGRKVQSSVCCTVSCKWRQGRKTDRRGMSENRRSGKNAVGI